MDKIKAYILLICMVLIANSFGDMHAQRKMENLGRGLVAVRTANTSAFISWRLLGTESWDVGFNIYRSSGENEAVKLNSEVLVNGTNYTDNASNILLDNTYFVKPVIDGVEQEASSSYVLKAYTAIEPCVVVPLKSGASIHFVWVGDLDGDGEYDYLVDRLEGGVGCKIEAYKNDGTYLWTVDMGPNSANMDNISPGSSAIDVGNWDGVTVYDMDNDGRAEVLVRTANGVIFGDSTSLAYSDDDVQFISVLDGLTGGEKARIQIPNNYISVGPMACSMGIGYLNGITPSLVGFFKNRNSDGSFNRLMCAWDYDGSNLSLKWKTNMPFGTSYGNGSDGHQMRIVDVDGDGKDEVAHIGFVLNGKDGSLKYNMGDQGIEHGDRWFVGKLDPYRPGLQGYGIQQYNSILDYYYDAATGELLWKHTTADGGTGDVGRGSIGDVDPDYPGYEVWHFAGLYNGPSNEKVSSNYAYPNLRIWWDGDLLSENLNDRKFEKYNYKDESVSRLLTGWNYHSATGSARNVPMFYGDIMGDWREEAVFTNNTFSELVIFTTNVETDHRIYTLPHNPAYRNSMTIKGYLQSHTVDYYLGANMTKPATPPIQTATCVWKGNGATKVWDVASTDNWTVNNVQGVFNQGDDVLFDLSAYPDTAIILSGEIAPSDIKVIAGINYALGGEGILTGSTGLLKAGNGALSLHCKATFTGSTSVEEGTLWVNDTLLKSSIKVYPLAGLGGTGVIGAPVTFMKYAECSPGALDTIGTLTFLSDLALANSMTIHFDITDDSTGLIKPSDKISINGNLLVEEEMMFSIQKADGEIRPGRYTLLEYTDTFIGSLDNITLKGLSDRKYTLVDSSKTIILVIESSRDAAAINWSGTSDTWDLLTTPAWTLNNTQVTFVAKDTVTFGSDLSTDQTINLEGTLPIGKMVVDADGLDYSFTGSGSIMGEASVLKTGNGKLALLTNNTYTGITNIQGGTLEVNSLSETGVSSSIGANASVDPSAFVLQDARLLYSGSANALTNKGITLAGASDTIQVASAGTAVIMEGVIAGTGDLVKTGNGTFTIKNENTFTGNTIIKQGELFLGNETANGAGLNTGSVTIENGTLSMSSGGYTTFNTNIIIPEGANATFNTDDRCNYRGTLTGSGTLNMYLISTIDRTVFFGDWSKFTGNLNITGASGTRFRIGNSYGYDGSTIYLGNNMVMYHGGSGSTGGDSNASTVKIGAISGSTSSSLIDENWVIGGKNEDCSFVGTIDGYSLKKVGNAKLVLRGNNTYTGGTTVSGGTLLVNNLVGSGTGTGGVKVNSGGKLGGTGIISGATTIYSGGELLPGNDGIGRLKLNSNLTLNPGSSLTIDINNKSYDMLTVGGNLVLAGTIQINKLDTLGFASGDFYYIFTASGYLGELEGISPEVPGEGLVWDTSELYTSGVLKVTNATGIKSVIEKSKALKLYPNPTQDKIYLETLNNKSIETVSVLSLKGQTLAVVPIHASRGSINLSSLTKGMYLLKIKSGDQIVIQRIIKE